MKIKKFTAPTEQLAIEQVKDDLGLDALVINIKKIQPRGLFSVFKKPYIEVLAAYDEKKDKKVEADEVVPEPSQVNQGAAFLEGLKQHSIEPDEPEPQDEPEAHDAPDELEQEEQERQEEEQFEEQEQEEQEQEEQEQQEQEQQEPEPQKQADEDGQDAKIKRLEAMLLTTGEMLDKVQSQLRVQQFRSVAQRRYQNNLVQIFYDTLRQNYVEDEICAELLDELDNIEDNKKIDINIIVGIVYNKIIQIVGEPVRLKPMAAKGNPKVLTFVGPTGVGKTTTIAKLTADFCLNQNLDIGLIAADTYRIAAIEQLKTFGDILNIDVAVAYKPNDILTHISTVKNMYDLVLIDTAGRSHKHNENIAELAEFLEAIQEEFADNLEIFLVLSLTTKLSDMLDIAMAYSKICDFKIIFTKMDETSDIGAILNVCHKTGKKLSYVTFGQNVPDDIKTVSPSELACKLLGLLDE